MHRPRYADLVATLALALALGGTAYAATNLPKHSVGRQQLKPDSVNSKKIKNGKVKDVDLATGSVGSPQLKVDAVNGSKIAPGSVGQGEMAAGSVGTAELIGGAVTGLKVLNNSIGLDDIVGADNTTAVSYSLAPGACTTLTFSVPGAQAGQLGAVSLLGTVDPGNVVFGPLRVATGNASARACNVGAGAANVSNLGVRVVTFD